MRHIVRQTVRTRLVVAFVVVAVVPLVIFGALVSWRMGTSLRDAERREIAAQKRGAEAALQRRVSDERAFIHDYTVWDEFHAAISEGNWRWIHDNITGWVSTTSPTKLVLLYDTAGHLIAQGKNCPAQQLWLSDVVQAAALHGRTRADLVTVGGDLFVLAAAPVIAQTHPSRPNGVLVFGQPVTDDVLKEVVRFTGGLGRLAIFTSYGVSATTNAKAANSPDSRPGAFTTGGIVADGKYSSQLVPLKNKQHEVVALLKVSVPREAFAAFIDEIGRIATAAFVIALVAAAAIGVVVAQTICTPLRRLAAAATAIAHGDLRQDLPMQRRDEIGSLAQAFNSMSTQVAKRIEGLSHKTHVLALEISNLSAFGATLARTRDPHAELCRLADMIRAMLDGDTVSVFLVFDDLPTRAAFSGGPGCGLPSSAEDELAVWAVTHGQGLELENIAKDDHLSMLARCSTLQSSFLVVPLSVQEDVVGALTVGFREPREFSPEELPLLRTIGGQIAIALQNAEAYEKLDRMYLETVTALAAAMEAKDQYTASHADSLAAMAVAVGRGMSLPDSELRMLKYAAVLHDIGKIGIPGTILNKPEELTREEFETMTQHTVIGERIISRIDYLLPIARIIRSAHERWDGTGYPDGLRGEEIPLASRILLVCDAFDAMTSDRPYRGALPVDAALEELRCHAGSQFDPQVVDAFLAAYPFETDLGERHVGRLGDLAGIVGSG